MARRVGLSTTSRQRLALAFFATIVIATVATMGVRYFHAFRVSLETRDGSTIATVEGPAQLLERLTSVSEMRRRCKFPLFVDPWGGVNWGDDVFPPTNTAPPLTDSDGCEDLTRHRYSAPGTYLVKASMGYLGPTDIPIHDWDTAITVTVPGTPIEVSDFTLIDVAAGQVFPYQKSIPVEWNLNAGASTDLTFEVVTESGDVAATQTFQGLRYVGHGKASVSLNSAKYDSIVKADMVRAHLRATARFGAKEVVRESGLFTLSAQYETTSDSAPKITVAREARSVSLQQTLWNPACDGYLIDWGDGSTPERKVAPEAPQQGCLLARTVVSSRHIYDQPGTYRIVLRTSSFSYQNPPEDAPHYEAFDVQIP